MAGASTGNEVARGSWDALTERLGTELGVVGAGGARELELCLRLWRAIVASWALVIADEVAVGNQRLASRKWTVVAGGALDTLRLHLIELEEACRA